MPEQEPTNQTSESSEQAESQNDVKEVPQEQPQEGVEIVSPMVGTFYASPDPNSPSFVNVGDEVSDDTTVCIVEAMKIFNEIKAQCNGSIIKVLVSSGDPVEFGQPLFLVKPQ